jgi:hypothetical protein
MEFTRFFRKCCYFAAIFALIACAVLNAAAQDKGTGILRGQITDPSKAAVVTATVVLTTPAGTAMTATVGKDGTYEFKNLLPGKYTVTVVADGFAPFKVEVDVSSGQIAKQDAQLTLQEREEKVVVSDQAVAKLDVDPASNAGAIVLQGHDLDALSDDPDELQQDLQALAGPSAGPNGGQIYIDGFTGGQLPPKSSIREIRINQNPFSSEFDKLGYGRIEILTKPGTDQYHGQFSFTGTDEPWNSKSPFVVNQPGYDTLWYSGSIGGPINKKSSFFFSAERRDVNDSNIIDAVTVDPSTLAATPFTQAIENPRARTTLNPRADFQLSPNNTLTVRYEYYRESETNDGIGQFALPSQAYNVLNTEQTIQIGDTQVINSKIINETRFQYLRDRNNQNSLVFSPQISVPDAFTDGGNIQGDIVDNSDRYEFQNYTSMVLGKHIFKFGGRLRDIREANNSTASFNGSYSFLSLENYIETLQGVPGAGPYLATVTTGIPAASINMFDAGLYAQDDWRLRRNMTLSLGLRFESQTDIHDHADFAPRVGFAWGLGTTKAKSPKAVIRLGWGMFYDRFANTQLLQAARLNGIVQQQFIEYNPAYCPNSPGLSCLNIPADPCANPATADNCSRYEISPNLRAPYTMQSAAVFEKALGRYANVSVTYLNSIGDHALLVNNINAPEPGTYPLGDPAVGTRPYGNVGDIFQYQSEGVFRQNEVIVNSSVRFKSGISVFGFYTLNYANSDTAGASTVISNPYNIGEDYGRAAFDVRHRIFMGGTMALPYAMRFSPFLVAQSGAPFNITLPTDLYGNAAFNSRPSFATNPGDNPADLYSTPYGLLNAAPTPGEKIIPINFGKSPARVTLNARFSKSFGFGKKFESGAGSGPNMGGGHDHGGGGGGGAGGSHGQAMSGGGGGGGGAWQSAMGGGVTNKKYNLTFTANIRNIFNVVNTGPVNGVLGSPFFGLPNSLAGWPYSSGDANRRVALEANFSF